MDLQTRKLIVIQYLIGIKDEKIFRRIENIIKETKSHETGAMEPLTKEQLVERAKKSNKDYKRGKFITQSELENESKEW